MTDEMTDEDVLRIRSEKRKPLVEAVITRLRQCRNERLSHPNTRQPLWSEEELAKLIPVAEQIKAKTLSYYRACLDCQKILPGRTFGSIRKKLYNRVKFGTWDPRVRIFSASSYKKG